MKRWQRWGMGLVFGLLGVAPAWGQTVRVWEAAVTDNFAVASRWNPDGKPTGTDSGRFNVTGSYTIAFTVNESFAQLLVDAGNVTWSSAATRQVDVTSIKVSNAGTDFTLGSADCSHQYYWQ
jgi:hypothetical protein